MPNMLGKGVNMEKLPKWNLSSIYKEPLSEEFLSDTEKSKVLAKELVEAAKRKDSILSLIERADYLKALVTTYSAYASALLSTDTSNPMYIKSVSLAEEGSVSASDALSKLCYYLKDRKSEFSSPELEPYKLFLHEIAVEADHQMSPEEESLANDMMRVSASSWERLQASVTSSIADGDKTLIELRGLATNPDRKVREDAFNRELKILEQHKVALAASLNGVKGTCLMLEKRRGWSDPLDRSCYMARISKKTLDALISALGDALPMFRSYFDTKAKLLGIDKMAFYDLFAPVGESDKRYTFEDAKRIVIDSYTGFSKEMGDFVRSAFENEWIDAEPHKGKVGGAYDTAFPLRGESRVLCNFDYSYDSVSTIAHELGHAYHDSIVKDLPTSRAEYPMTLAETASIFGEQIVFQEVLKSATKEEALPIIESFVGSAAQVCVDILSRFYFEKSAFEKRESGEVTPDEFSRLMLDAEERTYGDALSIKHPYMWAVKSHYYSAEFSFYNYPYAFGQLFALALFSKKDSVPDFPKLYKEVLALTGSEDAVAVAKAAGFDIESKEFWLDGIGVIAGYAERLKEWL